MTVSHQTMARRIFVLYHSIFMTEILFWIGIRGLMIWQTHQCKNMHKNLLL